VKRETIIINAPSNLGLRPLREGHEPGTWRAPDALAAGGLAAAIGTTDRIDIPRPMYRAEAQNGTQLRNGLGIRAFALDLARNVSDAIASKRFPIVVGGDCSVLLGALAGARKHSDLSLVHIDGHSDFRHPGNYDADAVLGAVAGMDLALVTGRGEQLLTEWPGTAVPLVPDRRVVQIGERESRDADFAWPDIEETAITRIDVFEARQSGATGIVAKAMAVLRSHGLPYWVHFDVDVLDQTVMPAVDSPGSPGIDPEQLVELLAHLVANDACIGLTVTIFDPAIDPDGKYASFLVGLLGDVFEKRTDLQPAPART
jgi:arginase